MLKNMPKNYDNSLASMHLIAPQLFKSPAEIDASGSVI